MSSANFGYTQGVISNGTPFVAELCKVGDESWLSVLQPLSETCGFDVQGPAKAQVAAAQTTSSEHALPTVLDLDMEKRSRDFGDDHVAEIVTHLVYAGLINPLTKTLRTNILYLRDRNGTAVVRTDIRLRVSGRREAETPLEFRRFPTESNAVDR